MTAVLVQDQGEATPIGKVGAALDLLPGVQLMTRVGELGADLVERVSSDDQVEKGLTADVDDGPIAA